MKRFTLVLSAAAKFGVLVVDVHPIMRLGIAAIINAQPDMKVCSQAESGTEAVRMFRKHRPDVTLMDLRLPGMSGVDLCRQLRAERVNTPIIVLSAIGDEIDKVLLLEIGADDYVVKPFGTRELLARIRALLRRAAPDLDRILNFAEVAVDLDRRITKRAGEEVKLTPAEYNLLTFFLQNPDRALSRDLILNSVWGYESYPNTRTVDAHVVRLRQKLEPDPAVPKHFVTVHGVGYRFLFG